jgi:putative transposase
MRQSCGVARKAYNEMLAMWTADYRDGLKSDWMKIQKKFIQKIDSEFPYMRMVSSDVYYQPSRHLGSAFSKFFKKTTLYPTFKKKGTKDSFKVTAVNIKHNNHSIKIAKIGIIHAAESPLFTGKIISATVNKIADTWEVSILYDTEDKLEIPIPKRETVGVDLGVKTAITLSSGEKIDSPKPLKKYLRKLKRSQRRLSNRKKGSKRCERQRMKVARIHRRIRNIRKDFLHKATTKIVDENQIIVLEDLNVKGMLRNHCLARAISDIGFGEFRRQIEYKAEWKGRKVIFADRFFPSSRLCPVCDHIHDGLTLKDREFICPKCNYHCDRDINAAENLESITTTQAHWESNGRGEAKAIGRRNPKRVSSMKRQSKLNTGDGPVERRD